MTNAMKPYGEFVPLFDIVIQEVGIVAASVYGRVWRYCQMDDKICSSAIKKIAKGNKYRPHRSDLGRQLFQSQIVRDSSELILCEGAKKTVCLQQETFPAIGVQGAHGFDLRWLPHFSATRRLYIAFDPDAMGPAYKLGQEITKASNIDVRIVSLPCKPDDFIWLYKGTARMFNEYLRYARRVR